MAGRTYFIDRLRVVLTVLVVVHHTAITYGGAGGWFYREVTDASRASSQALTVLCAVNQAFFMGLFFLIAGYYTPTSLARKGPRRFLLDRGIRLGLPLLVFGFVLGPLTEALAGAARGRPVLDGWLARLGEGRFVVGPLWFALALLLFAAGWVAWTALRRAPGVVVERPLPGHAAWAAAALAVGATALLLRQAVPVGETVLGLQLGYFASYLFLFALGCAAWPQRALERVGRAQALPWLGVGIVVLPLLFLAAAGSGAGQPVNVATGWSLAAVTYAFWEPFVAWGLIAGLLWSFRVRFDRPSPAWQAWADQAYGAFIVHAPVIVALAVALRGWEAAPLLKFAAVAVVGTVASFALAALLLRLPGARRVL